MQNGKRQDSPSQMVVLCWQASSFYLTREKLNITDPYLNAKNHPTLDVITIPSFYIKMSKSILIFDEFCTLAKFHNWI